MVRLMIAERTLVAGGRLVSPSRPNVVLVAIRRTASAQVSKVQRLDVFGALGSTGTFIATVTINSFMPERWDVATGGLP